MIAVASMPVVPRMPNVPAVASRVRLIAAPLAITALPMLMVVAMRIVHGMPAVVMGSGVVQVLLTQVSVVRRCAVASQLTVAAGLVMRTHR